jgi:hypothetical protein
MRQNQIVSDVMHPRISRPRVLSKCFLKLKSVTKVLVTRNRQMSHRALDIIGPACEGRKPDLFNWLTG